MTMATLDRALLRGLHTDVERNLQQLATRLGLGVRVNPGWYDEATGEYRMNVSFTLAATNGVDRDQAAFALLAPVFGLEAADFGRSFNYGGRSFRISGLKPGRPKYPVSAYDDHGKNFKFPAAIVASLLHGQS